MMKKYPFFNLTLTFAFAIFFISAKQAQAQDFTILEITGYNEDVIANGVGSLDTSTTSDVDGANYCFLAEGLQITESSTPITYGLPEEGILESPDITGLTYQLANYDENNVLRIVDLGEDGETTLNFTEVESFEALYLLVTSGSGTTTISGTINFNDATSQEFTSLAVPDWFYETSLPVVISGIGRGNRTNDDLENPSGNPRIYELAIGLLPDNQLKTVSGITIQKSGEGVFNLFGISGKIAAACITPANLSNTAISANTLSFSWEAESTQDTWEVALVESGEDAPETGTEVSTTSYEFDSLEANTIYDFYVRSNCGETNGYSEWIGPFTVTTACDLAEGLDENFDSSLTLSQCWDTINNQWYVASGGLSEPNYVTFGYANDDYLITAQFTVEANTNDRLEFWSKKLYNFYPGSIEVMLSTSGKQVANFTETLIPTTNVETDWGYYSVDLTDYVGETVFIAFHGTGSYMGIDDVMTIPIPLCDSPTGLKAENITQTSADLSWDAVDASAWEIVVQPYNSGLPETGVAVTTNSYEATIDPETIYEFYVRTACTDVEGFSPWAGPYMFGDYTPIEPISGMTDDVVANGVGTPATTSTNDFGGSYVFLSEDYQNTISDEFLGFGLPANGDLESSTPGLHFQMSPFDDPYTGNNALRIEDIGEEAAGTLTFNNTPNGQTVYISLTSGNGTCSIAGSITFDDDTTMEIPETPVPDWFNGNSLPILISGIGRINTESEDAENPNGNPRIYQLAVDLPFENQSKSISEITLYKTSGDGILNVFGASIRFPSSCPKPTDLTAVSDMTFTAANVDWTGGEETEWKIKYGEPGFNPDSEGELINLTDGTSETTLEGLTENTNYEVYVSAVCDEDSESEWTGPANFYTGYCNGSPLSNDGSGITNFQIASTDFPNGDVMYTDFTDTTLELPQAVIANIQITFATGFTYGTNIWIDLNDDLVFDSSELLFSGESTNSNPTTLDASFTMPMDAQLGNHRMRIATADTGQSTPNPCYTGSYGVTGDFMINVVPQPACLIPTGANIDEITQTTADITWVAGEDETEWVIAYGTPEFDPDNEGETVTVEGEASTTLDDLTFDTNYELYIKAICSDENESNWVGPIAFTTLVSCPAPVDIAIGDLTTTTADISWTAGQDETEWVVVYGVPGFNPEDGETIAADNGTPETTLEGLEYGNTYDVYVKGICGENDESEWTGPESIHIDYCSSVPTFIDDQGILNIEVGGTNFINNAVTYTSYTDTPVALRLGAMSNIQITFGTGYTYGTNIWIDLNDNLVFESSELVFTGQSLSNNPTTLDASFTMSSDAPLGNHTMRIGTADTGQATPNPCYSGAYGVTLDFNINIIPPDACPDPTNLSVGAISYYTTDINWSLGSDEAEWEVVYGAPGFNPDQEGESIIDNDTTAGITLTNLTPETDYEVYIKAICGNDNTSEWVGPMTFTTLQEPCFTPFGVVINSITTNSATVNWTEGGSAITWQVLYGETGFDTETEGSLIDVNENISTTISSLSAQTTYDVYVRAKCEENYYSNWTSIISFSTLEEQECVAPSEVEVSVNSGNTANVYWIENGSASAWEIKYGETGFNPENQGTTVEDIDGTAGKIITGLQEGTNYDVYVRAMCSAENYSEWSEKGSFVTLSLINENFKTFKFYPNPVKDQLRLQASYTIKQVTVYNLLGQQVMLTKPNALQTSIDMAHLQTGAYLMEVHINGTTKIFKLVRE